MLLRTHNPLNRHTLTLILLAFATTARLHAQSAPAFNLDRAVHADMDFLADDELHGRGSGTRDEHLAANFAASQMEALGLEPGGDTLNGKPTYIQRAPLQQPPTPRQVARMARFEDTPRTETWNAIAILRGSDPVLKSQVVLLTAHLDHLGMLKPDPANPIADLIFNGADDDASGTTAVLTLMHTLAAGPAPKRTIVFALFGSEETGGQGNAAFLKHPPVPLESIVANLEFEMIGRPDPLVPAGTLWLTGFDRSNLGPELAKHGAHLVNDPHPKEQFFQRSDNFALAKQGIIAHTVSSFGLHKDYHQVSDDLPKVDFPHMVHAIQSMQDPILWLANSDFQPAWNPNGKP